MNIVSKYAAAAALLALAVAPASAQAPAAAAAVPAGAAPAAKKAEARPSSDIKLRHRQPMEDRKLLVERFGAESGIVMGLFPGTVSSSDVTAYLDRYLPMMNELSLAAGELVSFVPEPSVSRFKERIAAGRYALVYVNAEIGAGALSKGYLPLAKRSDPIVSVVMTRADSKVSSVKDLEGVSVGAIGQAMVTSLARATFHTEKVSPKLVNAGSTGQDELVRNLDNGLVDGIILREETAKSLISKSKDKYRIAAQTGKAPGFILMGKASLGEEKLARLRGKMASLNVKTPEGKVILSGLDGKATSFEEASLDELSKMAQVFELVAKIKAAEAPAKK